MEPYHSWLRYKGKLLSVQNQEEKGRENGFEVPDTFCFICALPGGISELRGGCFCDNAVMFGPFDRQAF